MGSQIAIAQSPADEQELVGWLLRRHRFLAIPRVLPSRDTEPVELGKCQARDQVVFAAEDAAAVREHLREIVGRPGEFQVDWPKLEGLLIEWDRTGWRRQGEAIPGRLYYDRGGGPRSPSRQLMERTMRAVQRWIKGSYPLVSSEPPPTYVGPDLARSIREGGARVVYEKGTPIELVAND